MMKTLVWAMALVCSGLSSLGAEWYVSPTGDDKGVGSREAPYRTIARAASQVMPGDRVHLLRGLYREQVTFTRSGTAEAPITYLGERGEDGRFLTIVESDSTSLTDWTPAPDVHPDVWKCPLAARPQVVLQDGKMIVLIEQKRMELNRWEKVPETLETEMFWGDFGNPSTRIPGLDLLSLKADARANHRYFQGRSELFFPTIGHVLCGWRDGFLYIRYSDGSQPSRHQLTVSSGDGFTVRNASHLVFRDLHARGSTCQFHFTGDKTSDNVVDNCLLMHGRHRVLVEAGVSRTTLSNSILTLGFVQPKTFILRSKEDMRGGLLYLVFKYIVGTSLSDDTSCRVLGRETHIHDNVFMQGLIGVNANGWGTQVHHNVVREMSSVGIGTHPKMVGEVHHNLIVNCGIPIRIHNLRGDHGPREEYIYKNVLIQKPRGGAHIFVHCESHRWGPDQVNFVKGTNKYLENPPAPVDAGVFYIYHNTLWGGSLGEDGPHFSVRSMPKRFRMAMPFHFTNNAVYYEKGWCPESISMLAGNVLFWPEATLPKPRFPSVMDNNKVVAGIPLEAMWPRPWVEGIPDVSIAQDSPLCGAAIDVSRPFAFNGKDYAPLKGFAPGYFTGEKPAAGALQAGESFEEFLALHRRFLNAVKLIE